MRHPYQSVPSPLKIQEALAESAALSRLRDLLAQSTAHLDAIMHLLPASLKTQIKAGPIDADGWTLLVTNAAVAAKVRHLLPHLESEIRARGWQLSAIRVRIQQA